jgi:hypothetical protein
MKDAAKNKKFVLKLKKPKAISGENQNWFDPFYEAGTQKEQDRLLFSSPEVT